MIYLLLKLELISETDNGNELEFQCQINHGPEWNMEFSIPIQFVLLDSLIPIQFFCLIPYRHFSNRPFSYSDKKSGSSVIFIHFYTRDSIEWR